MAPEGWRATKLGDELMATVGGGTPNRSNASYWGGSIPWATVKDFGPRVLLETQEHISEEGLRSSASNLVPANTVVMATRMNVGAVFRSGVPIAINQDLRALIPAQSLSTDYLFYFLQANSNALGRLATGTTVKGLRTDTLRSLQVQLPPLPEQRKIAAILSSVDDAIEKTQAIVSQVQVVKHGLMQELLTRGLPRRHTHFKRTDIGEIPAEWHVVELASVASIERGKFAHRPRNEPRFYGGRYPFIQTGDVAACDGLITTYNQTLNEQGLTVSKLFPAGTIVITIAANIGSTGIATFDVAFPDSLIGIQAGPRIDTRFLELVLRTRKRDLNRFASESAQKNINLDTLKPLKVPLPRMTEQRRIAELLWSVIRREQNANLHRDGLARLKSALTSVLITGELRVTPETEAA